MILTEYKVNCINQAQYKSCTFCASEKKGDIIVGDFQNYRKVRNDFQKESIIETIKKRIPSLPKLMNILISAPVEYVDGAVGANKFSNDYIENFVPFSKRIAIGEHHEEYCKSYNPEINMIQHVEKACNSFVNDEKDITKLNAEVENALEKYAKAPIKRTKLFIA